MMSKIEDQSREQVIMISLEDLVPENHLVRALDKAID
jgi:transposase